MRHGWVTQHLVMRQGEASKLGGGLAGKQGRKEGTWLTHAPGQSYPAQQWVSTCPHDW